MICQTPHLLSAGVTDLWHPWKHAGENYPHFRIYHHHELPEHTWGLTSFERQIIWLCKRLNQAKRRCTLTHELVHIERGEPPTDRIGHAREEREVGVIAARRLITLPQLIDAYRERPGGDDYAMADKLWVDVPTLRARLDNLEPLETTELEHQLGDLWIP